jgi:hypothetical protein
MYFLVLGCGEYTDFQIDMPIKIEPASEVRHHFLWAGGGQGLPAEANIST